MFLYFCTSVVNIVIIYPPLIIQNQRNIFVRIAVFFCTKSFHNRFHRYLQRCSGALGATNSVAWAFQRRSLFLFNNEEKSEDQVMEDVLEGGAEDVQFERDITKKNYTDVQVYLSTFYVDVDNHCLWMCCQIIYRKRIFIVFICVYVFPAKNRGLKFKFWPGHLSARGSFQISSVHRVERL